MNITDFTARFAGCFNTTPANEIQPDTEFKKLEEWGSMMALIVIAMVDGDCNKTITSEDLKEVKTVNDLYALISNK